MCARSLCISGECRVWPEVASWLSLGLEPITLPYAHYTPIWPAHAILWARVCVGFKFLGQRFNGCVRTRLEYLYFLRRQYWTIYISECLQRNSGSKMLLLYIRDKQKKKKRSWTKISHDKKAFLYIYDETCLIILELCARDERINDLTCN